MQFQIHSLTQILTFTALSALSLCSISCSRGSKLGLELKQAAAEAAEKTNEANKLSNELGQVQKELREEAGKLMDTQRKVSNGAEKRDKLLVRDAYLKSAIADVEAQTATLKKDEETYSAKHLR